MKKTIISALSLIPLFLCPLAQAATASEHNIEHLRSMSLAELLNVEIVSASRQDEKLFNTSSAVYVITQEDIRRSGLTSIPELLRMVPGFSVAQLDSAQWAISSRGFKDRYADKLLVMIDGRSVYTPLFGGVYWDVQDYLLSDIERIEVIRGPGATMWGANAVNGIVNIITKNSQDTLGGRVEASTGSQQDYIASARYGAGVDENIFWRLYGKGAKWPENEDEYGNNTFDDGEKSAIGFRLDWLKDFSNTLNIHGDYYDGKKSVNKWQEEDINLTGGNIMVTWNHEISAGSDWTMQCYFDRTERHSSVLGEDRNTVELDLQHRYSLLPGNAITWGGMYRYTNDQTDPNARTTLTPTNRSDEIYSAYIQDKITLMEKYLWLTVGNKFEYNDYTDFENQPSVRLLALPNQQTTIWGAISRSIKTPSRVDHDFDLVMGQAGPFTMLAKGNDQVESEVALTYELGYRFQSPSNYSVDIAAYYSDYDNLQSKKTIIDPAERQITLTFDSTSVGRTYGGEILVNWQAASNWQLTASYSYLDFNVTMTDSGNTLEESEVEGKEPRHQAQFRSYWNITEKWEFDLMTYYVDELYEGEIDDYLRLDLRLGWHPQEALEISFGVQNALDSSHPEEVSTSRVFVSNIKRNLWGKITWEF